MCFNWLAAIIRPDAVMKPEITGCDKKFAINPRFNKPMVMRIKPDIIAKVIANETYSGLPGIANWLQEAEVIKAITATGPTAKVLEVPNIAYRIKGIIEAYKPTSGGNPANIA